MFRIVVIATLMGKTTAASFFSKGGSKAFLGTDMQPATVAKTLVSVEDEWKRTAWAYIQCEKSESGDDAIRDCDNTPGSFSKSCATVVNAIVKGSNGDSRITREYMVDVCKQESMGGWQQAACVALAKDVSAGMTASAYDNRVHFPAGEVCDNFWGHFLEEQKPVEAAWEADQKQKETEAAAAQKKRAEEAEVARAENERKAAERAAKTDKDVTEALAGDVAKEEIEIEAERKQVALRSNRSIDRSMQLKEAEVEGVVDAAQEKIDEATKVEEEEPDEPAPVAEVAAASPTKSEAVPTNTSKGIISNATSSVKAVADGARAALEAVSTVATPVRTPAHKMKIVKDTNATVSTGF